MFMILDLRECEYLKDKTEKSVVRRPTEWIAKNYARRYAKEGRRPERHFVIERIPKGSRL